MNRKDIKSNERIMKVSIASNIPSLSNKIENK